MRKTILFVGVVILSAQSSCLTKRKKLDQLWFYSYSNKSREADNPITPANFLSLQSDGSYTRDFGKFEQGTWKKENSILYLRNKSGIIEFPIKSFFENELQLVSNKGTILHFESVPRNFSTPVNNPFSFANNQWRIPATRKENDQEIKSRLKNHFRFYEFYFDWALNNHFESVDVNNTPSLIKIYGNGFELKPLEKLPKTWKGYFFDEGDCGKANEIIKHIFEHHEISWPITENKFKMFISAFQQLQQQLSNQSP